MKIIKYIKSIIISVMMIFFQIVSPQKQIKLIKNLDSPEENDDISDEDKALFIANAIEYNPATRYILHEYYKLFNNQVNNLNNQAYVIKPILNINEEKITDNKLHYKQPVNIKRA